MNIVYCTDYDDMSIRAASLVISEVERRSDLLLGAATGRSPDGLYRQLVQKSAEDEQLFEELRIVKLDEWGGLSENDPGSCEHYLRTRLLEPLKVSPDRYIAFASTSSEPSAECERIRRELARRGPIDLCILGLGVNGHLGFNEPGPSLIPHCHVARLTAESRRHAMVEAADDKPRFGLTLGMQEILASRRIVLLVAGEGKTHALHGLLAGAVSTTLPASFLWLHPNVECLIDGSVYASPATQ